MPDAIEVHIARLQSKLNVLLKQHEGILAENKKLRTENARLILSGKEQNSQLVLMEQQLNILKSSAGRLEGEEKKAFEKTINQYIKTIDKCMTLLNN